MQGDEDEAQQQTYRIQGPPGAEWERWGDSPSVLAKGKKSDGLAMLQKQCMRDSVSSEG